MVDTELIFDTSRLFFKFEDLFRQCEITSSASSSFIAVTSLHRFQSLASPAGKG